MGLASLMSVEIVRSNASFAHYWTHTEIFSSSSSSASASACSSSSLAGRLGVVSWRPGHTVQNDSASLDRFFARASRYLATTTLSKVPRPWFRVLVKDSVHFGWKSHPSSEFRPMENSSKPTRVRTVLYCLSWHHGLEVRRLLKFHSPQATESDDIYPPVQLEVVERERGTKYLQGLQARNNNINAPPSAS